MNLPNQLTLARLVLTGVFVACVAFEVSWAWTASLVIFIIASLTDWFDGWYARKHQLVTAFGALMDPLADKILTSAAFVLLACAGAIPGWVVCTIISREFAITGLRLVAASRGTVLSADQGGKWKTGSQIALIIYWMWLLATREPAAQWTAPVFSLRWMQPDMLGRLFLIATVGTTVVSGWRYLSMNRHILKETL